MYNSRESHVETLDQSSWDTRIFGDETCGVCEVSLFAPGDISRVGSVPKETGAAFVDIVCLAAQADGADRWA